MSLRGTEVALYDYARYNEELLGNHSIIISHANDKRNDETVIDKFKKRFGNDVFFLDGSSDDFGWKSNIVVPLLDEVLQRENCHWVYMQKGGKNDGVISQVCPSMILACSNHYEPHGYHYAYVSNWLSKINSNGKAPVVPAMIDLYDTDEDLREELCIPRDAYVFGRTGGEDPWNLPFASDVVNFIIEKSGRDDIYFLFQNTPKFHHGHKNIIHIKNTPDMEYKTIFINTCDAMLHARFEGESFGSTCGEFSLRNKPIITWHQSRERSHIEILGDKGLYYNSPQDLFDILTNFKKEPEKDWNCYKEYNPHTVMTKFQDVFFKIHNPMPKFNITDTPNVQTRHVYGNDSKNKYAAFYTVHNRLDELDVNSQFFNRSDFLTNNFDVIINCNALDNTERVKDIAQSFKSSRVVLVFDSKNEGSYHMGPMEQAANSFHELYDYELAFQIHPDVYIISDHGIKKFVEDFRNKSYNERCDYYAFTMPERDGEYAYDFWFCQPSPKTNVFTDFWKDYALNSPTPWGEPYLWDLTQQQKLKVGLFDRSPRAGMDEAYEESSGLRHSKDLEEIKKSI